MKGKPFKGSAGGELGTLLHSQAQPLGLAFNQRPVKATGGGQFSYPMDVVKVNYILHYVL